MPYHQVREQMTRASAARRRCAYHDMPMNCRSETVGQRMGVDNVNAPQGPSLTFPRR